MNTERLQLQKVLAATLEKKKEISQLAIDFIDKLSLSIPASELSHHRPEDLVALLHAHWNFFSYQKEQSHTLQLVSDEHSLSTQIHLAHQNYPFLIDTLTILLQDQGFSISHIFFITVGVERDSTGHVMNLFWQEYSSDQKESSILLMLKDLHLSPDRLEQLYKKIIQLLQKLQHISQDFHLMKNRFKQFTDYCVQEPLSKSFLNWIANDRYIFLGTDTLVMDSSLEHNWIPLEDNERLGLLKAESLITMIPLNKEKYQIIAEQSGAYVFTKDINVASVHRQVYYDVLYLKEYNHDKKLIKMHRVIGLLTAQAYQDRLQDIPLINQKIEDIFEAIDIEKDSFDGQKVQHQLTLMNRNDILYHDVQTLASLLFGVYHLRGRSILKLFVLSHRLSHSLICYVYVPRDLFNSTLRIKFQEILMQAIQATSCTFEPLLSECSLARIRFELHGHALAMSLEQQETVENKLREATYLWQDKLRRALSLHVEPKMATEYFRTFQSSFPLTYQDFYNEHHALKDIFSIAKLNDQNPLSLRFFKENNEVIRELRLKLFQYDHLVALSEIIPILENFGLKIIKNRLFELKLSDRVVWLNDMTMQVYQVQHDMTHIFNEKTYQELESAFKKVMIGQIENDGFNKLITATGMVSQQIVLIRAWAKYLRQINFPFSQNYIEDVSYLYPQLIQALVRFFEVKFDPLMPSEQKYLKLNVLDHSIQSMLDAIAHLDADKILRKLYNLLLAIVRTNYYQLNDAGQHKEYISFKFNPNLISEMPSPIMQHEIFVYAPDVEGVHLRSSNIARGGIRWSDRVEDYRTEVLGLVKAQQVKNSIIVPAGAKGGFILRNQSKLASKEAVVKAGIDGYKTFIRGLLDLTDNLQNGIADHPKNTVILDHADPYLVVAADKGTATFSDIANALSKEYNFWLGDAFASGGSQGYDHKKIGITARGTFASVKNHFREMNIDIERQSVTVIGIGDMSGDVFGNGALLAPLMKFVGAFNHLDIFLDPNPDPSISFKERQRLFDLGKGSWSDYNPMLISPGGGVFSRKVKSISLSLEIKKLLGTDKEKMSPAELIHSLLQTDVDLIFNGGIGTYVKSRQERHADVGDKQNDALRIDGAMLRCKVFAEGGNLGATQKGRIEFSKLGGKINTDTLDNSGGVDCSDHEVNIKILLEHLIHKGYFARVERDALLASMTQEVAQLVLKNNDDQNYTISMMHSIAVRDLKLHQQVIQDLTERQALDRDLEFLPTDEEIALRILKKEGLTRPELIVLMSYVKMDLKAQLAQEDLQSYPLLNKKLYLEFPALLEKSVGEKVFEHPLKNNIIATMLANTLVNEVGASFVYRIRSETQATYLQIVHCYFIAREIFHHDSICLAIRALPRELDRSVQYELTIQLARILYRATRWCLNHKNIQQVVVNGLELFKESVNDMRQLIAQQADQLYAESPLSKFFIKEALSQEQSHYLLTINHMLPALDLHLLKTQENLSIRDIFPIYVQVGELLKIKELELAIENLDVQSAWDALARHNLKDDLEFYQLQITKKIITTFKQDAFAYWKKSEQLLLKDWEHKGAELQTLEEKNFVQLSVHIRMLDRFIA